MRVTKAQEFIANFINTQTINESVETETTKLIEYVKNCAIETSNELAVKCLQSNKNIVIYFEDLRPRITTYLKNTLTERIRNLFSDLYDDKDLEAMASIDSLEKRALRIEAHIPLMLWSMKINTYAFIAEQAEQLVDETIKKTTGLA